MNDLIYFLGVQIFSLPDIDNEEIIKNIKWQGAICADENAGGDDSHFGLHGGWDVGTPAQQEAQKLKNNIQKILTKFYEAKIDDKDYWIHVVKPQEDTIPHHHGDNGFSFCYYLNNPQDSGDFEFNHDCPNYKFHYKFKPRVGELFVFPSYLQHQASTNESNENRYSFAGNAQSEKYKPQEEDALIMQSQLHVTPLFGYGF